MTSLMCVDRGLCRCAIRWSVPTAAYARYRPSINLSRYLGPRRGLELLALNQDFAQIDFETSRFPHTLVTDQLGSKVIFINCYWPHFSSMRRAIWVAVCPQWVILPCCPTSPKATELPMAFEFPCKC